MRDYIREKKQPNEFMRILHFMREVHKNKDTAGQYEIGDADSIKETADELYELCKKEWLTDDDVFKIKETIEDLHQLTFTASEESVYYNPQTWNIVEILSNPNVTLKFFKEQKHNLNAEDLDTVMKNNMNLWREEDLPDQIIWNIPVKKSVSSKSETIIKEYTCEEGLASQISKLNRNIPVKYVKEIYEDRDGVLDPNLTLKTFKKIGKLPAEYHDILYDDDVFKNNFFWNYDICSRAFENDVRDRANILRNIMNEFMTEHVINSICVYINYK